MKRLRTSLLPMLLAFLACGAFFPAKAQEAAQGTVYYVLPLQDMAGKTNFIPTSFDIWYQCASITQKQETIGTVSNANVYTFTTSGTNSSSGGWLSNGFDISPILTGDYDLLFDFRTNKSASYRIKLVIPATAPAQEVGNETEFTATPNGQWQTIRMNVKEKFPAFATSGATSGKAYVFAFVANGCQNGDTFDFANVRYVPKGTTDEPVVVVKPTGKFTYTITDNKCDFTVDVTPGSYTLEKINVWAEAAGVRSYQVTSTENPFTGSFTVPVEAFGDNATLNYYVKAEAIFNDGYTIAGNDKTNMVGTDVEKTFTKPVVTTPALSIAEASCAYKSATSVTASMKLNVENIDGTIRMAVLSTDENLGSSDIWNQDDKPYKILAEKTVSAAEAAAGVTFDVENLPESTATPIVFAACTTGDTPVYAATKEGVASTSQTEPGMVNTVYSESYNVAPYTNGISYTAANFNEDGSVKWTFPSWAKEYTENGQTVTTKNGISGRWVKIEKSAVENAEFYAPEITYTLSNDVDGYMYFSMTIHSDNIPAGLKPEFWVNNNRNQEDVNMTVVEGTNNKQWTWKSHYQYPNNHIISYQLYLSSSVGNAATRVFGYEVRGATNGRVKQPANVELEKIAENAEIYQGKNISAQIYFLQAYDAYSAPQDDFKDKPIPMGTWSYTRCPSDFSNLNTEAFHFSPEIIYFVSNAVEDNKEDKKSKLYFSFQLGKSYGIVDGEERELSTIIPNDYVPQLIVYVPKENTTATTNAGLRANETVWVENEVTNMSQVRNYLNTYEVTSAKEYAANSNIKVGIKHTFTSIMGGKGYSVMEPRGYVMSSKDEVITGIEEVASEAEAVPAVATVYNLQGMAVRVNVATENALEGLPAGIYIVNGKKYAVR